MDIEVIYEKLKAYFEWESEFDFSGWENVEIIFGETLVDAWLKARPQDSIKFENKSFYNMVMDANGKWLEKQSEDDNYKILIALNDFQSEKEVSIVIAHELRHCLDFQNAVKELDFKDYHPGNKFYSCWSEFRAVSVSVRCEICLDNLDNQGVYTSETEWFKRISEILGRWAANCVEGLMCNEGNARDELYFICRYVGATRAIQNININEGYRFKALNLWYMLPRYIEEKYGNVFYLGNEWNKKITCSLDAVSETGDFIELLEKLGMI